jgi:predicted heme/steroid binding protein
MEKTVLKKTALLITLLLTIGLLAGCTQAATPAATAAPTATADAAVPTAATNTATPTAATASDATATAAPTATAAEVALPVFDAAELAKYDGKNGNRAYVAVEGKVYDVTDVPQWANGSHFGKFQAGQDLTTEIETLSPHGVSKLDSVPIVGLYQP